MAIRLRTIRDRPLLTEIHGPEFCPQKGVAYVFGRSQEERSEHIDTLRERSVDVAFVEISHQEEDHFETTADGSKSVIALRSSSQLSAFCNELKGDPIFLDITGLSHHVWAPLLRAAVNSRKSVLVVYVEPWTYRYSETPTEGEIFDLSERISGIAPIAGFACLNEPSEEDRCFVPLLGFEGTRLSFVLEQVQPVGQSVVPIVGVPGFRPEFPFYTYLGNRLPLSRSLAWLNVRFAIANCPFSLFYELQGVAADYPRSLLQIAPIGTKPHALGAVLYALASPRQVELVYDHPIRRPQRTTGINRLLVYDISSFLAGTFR